MQKKRTSAESNYEDEADEASQPPFQRQDDDAKRAKLDPESDTTTLQDLPIELLEYILVKAVVMEVRSMKLAKSVWKEKAEQVINRLGPVCSRWLSTLTTNSFRTKLHRILDGIAQTIRLEILLQSSMPGESLALTTLKDEIFLLYRQLDGFAIDVYSRDNLNEVKEVIPLPDRDIYGDIYYMTGCNVSNCVYLCSRMGDFHRFGILRISRDAEHKFNISTWKNDSGRAIIMMTVSPNGSLILRSFSENSYVVSVCNADGTLQYVVKLSPDIHVAFHKNGTQKSNGNLVLACVDRNALQRTLMEFDARGNVVRQFRSSYVPGTEKCLSLADSSDRIITARAFEGIELFDSELNLIGVYSLQKDKDKRRSLTDLHYDSYRNEIVCNHFDESTFENILTIFRFAEE